MSFRMVIPLLFGLIGGAILLSLGVWQIKRLAWKEDIIARIEAKVAAQPVSLPQVPSEAADEYLAVQASGRLLPPEIHVLSSKSGQGPGYRVLSRFQTGERVILLDLGFIPQSQKTVPRAVDGLAVTGNLLWPDEVDKTFTPDPDIRANIWYARDVAKITAEFPAEPVLIVARTLNGPDGNRIAGVIPWPISAKITNDHMQYAITWFSLAIIWLGMTAYLLWRIRQKTV